MSQVGGILWRLRASRPDCNQKHYKISPKGLSFWDIHVEADAEHSGDEFILNTYATILKLQAEARRVAMEGVYRRFGGL